jgi:hypothetical protein
MVAPATQAARVRFHYSLTDACGTMAPQPAGPGGSAGARLTLFGSVRPAECGPPRPNQVVTFRHPFSGQMVKVPVALPEGTPDVEFRTNWIVYNYGSYTVEVHFLPDGTVDVVYNSGLFRAL